MGELIRVFIVDRNALLLEGVAALIRTQPDMLLAGSAATSEAGLVLIGASPPDIVLIDVDPPGTAGISLIQQLSRDAARIPVIGLVAYELDRSGLEALKAGAVAILEKSRLGEALIPLIRRVAMAPGSR
ncbi:response regulator [Paludibaculum fermentans]|uniref:response regulator n=1 Tax=Paludibaculum fermentans TaxID=1473598 RepID=UPI003EBD5B30